MCAAIPVTDARGITACAPSGKPRSDECGAPAAVVTEKAHTRLASVYFPFNKATPLRLNPRAKPSTSCWQRCATSISRPSRSPAMPTSSVRMSYNQRLSEKRARAVQHYLEGPWLPACRYRHPRARQGPMPKHCRGMQRPERRQVACLHAGRPPRRYRSGRHQQGRRFSTQQLSAFLNAKRKGLVRRTGNLFVCGWLLKMPYELQARRIRLYSIYPTG